jgi:hypothetical protein
VDSSDNSLNYPARTAVGLASLAALGFAVWLYVQDANATTELHHGPVASQPDPHADDWLNPDINATDPNIPCDQLPANAF